MLLISVIIDGTISSELPVTSGVPQGSILGPSLYQWPTRFCTISLFADDTKCIKAISSPHDSILLQNDLTALNNWSSNWEFTFSNSKCKLLSIPPPNQLVHSANYSINNSIINSTSLHRDLGVLVSNNLTWDEHYSAIISRAYKSLYFIRRATRSDAGFLADAGLDVYQCLECLISTGI